MTKKFTDSRFDILKGVMCLFIVILHTQFFPEIFIPLVRTGVPVFFIMSSYFFFRKIYSCDDRTAHFRILGRFVRRSLLLYLFWFIVLLPATVIRRGYFSNGWSDILSVLTDFLFDSTFAASWFIVACIIGVTIVFMARKHMAVVASAGVLCYIVCCEQSAYFGYFPQFNACFADLFGNYCIVNSFPVGIIWISLGAVFARFPDKGFMGQRCLLVAWGAGLILLYLEHQLTDVMGWERSNDCFISLLLVCPALFLWIKGLKPVYYPWSLNLRHATVIIYCLHATVAFGLHYLLRERLPDVALAGIVNFALTMLVVCSASYVILRLSRRRGWRWLGYAY